MSLGTSSLLVEDDNPPAFQDDAQLANQIRILFQRARASRRSLVAQWNRNYRILRNRTWGEGRPAWLPSPEVPEIYPIISSIVGWMTDQRPNFDVIPASQPNSPFYSFYSDLANDLSTVLDGIWKVHEYEAEVEQVIWDGFTYGTGIFKSGWDDGLVAGQGDAVLRRVDPYTFYPDPAATSFYDCNYMIEVRTMSLQEMDRRWPGSMDKFQLAGYIEDIDQPPSLGSETTYPKANPGAISPATTPRYGLPGQSRLSGQALEDPGVTVFEAWLREHEFYTNDRGEECLDDKWRCVVVAGNLVLMDEPADELWSHGQHPYSRYVPHRTGEFWGLSMVDFLRPSQLAINRLLASLQLNIELTGNPVLKENERAGIARTKITNKPGQRLKMADGGQLDWLIPPQLNALMPELIKFYIGEMERISGLSAISRGMAPTGRNAQGVIDSIQEASFVRIRLALRNLEWALRDAGAKIASLVTENYTAPRVVAMVGNSGEQSSLALLGKHFYVPTQNGRLPMRFQLLVSAGSEQATSRMARIQEADTLYAMGAIDREALLTAHNYPNRKIISKRIALLEAAGAFNPPGARQRTGRKS